MSDQNKKKCLIETRDLTDIINKLSGTRSLYEVISEMYGVDDGDATKLMIRFDNLIESLINESKYKYASTQVNLPDNEAEIIGNIASRIDPNDLHEEDKGKDEAHITVKYGIVECDVDVLKDELLKVAPISARLGKLSCFNTDEYDVLKVDVISDDLHKLNELVCSICPHIDTYPEYKPHITVAYIKKGKGDKYVGNHDLEDHEMEFDVVKLSNQDGDKTDLKLGGDVDDSITEATPKSAEERVHRRTRLKKPDKVRDPRPVAKKEGDNDPRSSSRGRRNLTGHRKEKQDRWKRDHPEKFTEAIEFINTYRDKPSEINEEVINRLQYPGRLIKLLHESARRDDSINNMAGMVWAIMAESAVKSAEFSCMVNKDNDKLYCVKEARAEAEAINLLKSLVWIEKRQVNNIISYRAVGDRAPSKLFAEGRSNNNAFLLDDNANIPQ